MTKFNLHKFFKSVIFEKHLLGLKTLPAMLNKRSTGADVAGVDRSLLSSFVNVQ